MSKKIRKSVIIFLVINICLASCAVKGPEEISWSTETPNDGFSNVDTDTDISDSQLTPPPADNNSNESDIPWNELLREENRLNCTQNEILAYECFGNSDNGYKCIQDTCYLFYNKIVYRMSPAEAENYKRRVLGAYVASRETNNMGWAAAGLVATGIGLVAGGPIVGLIVGAISFGIAAVSFGNEQIDNTWEKYARKGGAEIMPIKESELEPYRVK